MTTTSKKPNGTPRNGHVSISLEEYNAFSDLSQRNADLVAQNAKTTNRNHDLLLTCDAQARRLVEIDLIMQHHDRVNGLQRAYIDLLRADQPSVANLEDLSEFWRQWVACTEKLKRAHSQQREAVTKIEPDLFRTWNLWASRSGSDRAGRAFSVAGTRGEVEAQKPATQANMQDDIVNQLKDRSARLAAQVKQLENEIEAYKNNDKDKSKDQ